MGHNQIVQLLDKGSRKGIQPGVRSCWQLCSVCCSRTSPTATAHSMQWLIQSSPSRWCIHVTHSAASSSPCALCSRTISLLPAACGSQDHGGKVVMRIWCQPKACVSHTEVSISLLPDNREDGISCSDYAPSLTGISITHFHFCFCRDEEGL